ncbi:unnamed protein product, partial [Callosobruchus maculatus]
MNKEKLPKLVDVYRPSKPLNRRQLPLVIDENLTLVMDVKSSGIICDNQILRGKDLEEFALKWSILKPQELQAALQITKSELMHVLNQNVPCVGCRRSVDRLYYQLFKFGHPTLDPLVIRSDGIITIKEEKQAYQIVGSIFHDHAARLAKLIETQPKRNKKSVRCLLHSLDSQRSRPLTPAWRDVWDCMKPHCKKEVCIIEASSLHTTLETYLRKHRFCGECRMKVLKAYTLLVEEPDPTKEKGYVSSLYAGIKRCLPDKHIHLQTKTEYITKLISRAEPELLGSRRERHAKTMEIAQEEVLTCLGICVYERLHRVAARVREEERTCRVFAAAAVYSLSENFESAVERFTGVSKTEILYEELQREERQRLQRKEQKKIKRKRKKGKTEMVAKDGAREECSCADSEEGGKQDDDAIGCEECGGRRPKPVEGGACPNGKPIGDVGCTAGEEEGWMEAIGECKCGEGGGDGGIDETPAPPDGRTLKEVREAMGRCKCDTRSLSNCFNGMEGVACAKRYTTAGSNNSDSNSHDCGYSSENNNGCCGDTGSLVSSLSSSPAGSELACSE